MADAGAAAGPAPASPAGEPAPSLDGLHIVLLTAFASSRGGGVATAVAAQARMIRDSGGRATIVALHDARGGEALSLAGDTPLLTATVTGPAQIGYAPGLPGLLRRADPDLVHLHGIWMYPSRAGALWARASGRPYLISPHGMLDPWITARGRWKKAIARAVYERDSWRRAAALHALTGAEAADIRREAGAGPGAGTRPVLVIPNAGPPGDGAAAAGPPDGRDPLVLYLGRIHPKKNLAALIDGWARAELPPGARLAIAGWGEPQHVAALERRLASAPPSVAFLGPAHGPDKQRLIASARFMILPSHSEGLPMAMLESWAAGTPTIMTPACHLPEGVEAGAALPCGIDPPSIAAALRQALALDAAGWRAMSGAALALARGRFSPACVAAQWATAYRALLARTGR